MSFSRRNKAEKLHIMKNERLGLRFPKLKRKGKQEKGMSF
jgi:hypothetical protein